MSVYSGKSSDSTLWGALKRRISSRRRCPREQEREFDRGWSRENYGGKVRSFENLGYAKHELPSGSEIYLSTLEDDLFFEYDDPKPINSGGRFADEALNLVRPKVHEYDSFVSAPCFSQSPQVILTSSNDTVWVEAPEGMDYDELPGYELESLDKVPEIETCPADIPVKIPETETEVERLPASPLFKASVEKAVTETIEAESELPESAEEPVIDEGTDPAGVKMTRSVFGEILLDITISIERNKTEEPVTVTEEMPAENTNRPYEGPVLYTRRYPELTSPAELLALPQEIEYSTVPNPPEVILLPEAKTYGPVHGFACADSVYAPFGASASLCDTECDSILQVNGSLPLSFESEEILVTDIPSIESCLVDYADFAGYDFLPEATAPERRVPRKTVNAVPEESENRRIDYGVHDFGDFNRKESEETDEADISVKEDCLESPDSDYGVTYELSPAPDIKPKISFMFGTGNRLHNFY